MLEIETPSGSSGRVLGEIFSDAAHESARNRGVGAVPDGRARK